MPTDTAPRLVDEQTESDLRDFLSGFLADKESREDFLDERFLDGFAVALYALAKEIGGHDIQEYQDYTRTLAAAVCVEIDAEPRKLHTNTR